MVEYIIVIDFFLQLKYTIDHTSESLTLLAKLVLPFDSGIWADAVVEHKVP